MMATSSTTSERPWPDEWPQWLGDWSRLTGRQRPEVECWFPGDESEGDATAKFGIKVGIRLLPWELMVIRAFDSIADPDDRGDQLGPIASRSSRRPGSRARPCC